jgi:cytochrome c-type biogenesis protein CcmH
MTFWPMFILMLVAASIFILYPFISSWRRSSSDFSVEQTNVAIFREQQEQFQRQLNNAEISQIQYEQLLADAQQLLLTNTATEHSASQLSRSGLWLLPVLIITVPLITWLSYNKLGAYADEEIVRLMEQGPELTEDAERFEQWREQLDGAVAQRAEQRPENVYYWVMLAQSALAEGDLLSASQHLAAAVEAQPEDGYLLAQYAETLFLLQGSTFSAPVVDAMERAFAVDSSNPTVLGLKGIQAFQNGQLQLAVTYWLGARQSLDPASSTAQALLVGIERAEKILSGGEPLSPEQSDRPKIKLSVSLDSNIVFTPDQLVFVAVVAASGSPMPLAARKLRAADLPATLTLSDSDALMTGRGISSTTEVRLVARLSATGSATPQSGDWETSSEIVELPSNDIIRLFINRQRP